ncbi:MAG: DUF6502 family protein [Caldimonas sp.]
MKRAPPENLATPAPARARPTPESAELALKEAGALMAPVALWLLRNGVSYPAFAELLKSVFVAAARGELERSATKPTQSSLSLLSGVHRKDVRALGEPVAARPPRRPPLSSQVFTRWLTDRRYRDKDGQPRALPRTGDGRSFETLCKELSNDVHPRAVLDELLRLGQVGLDGERVVALSRSFVPLPRHEEMTALFSANVADHIAAAVSNLTSDSPRFLEQSVYADGMTQDSIDLLHAAAREAWAHAFEALVTRARERVDHDRSGDGDRRMRFGSYFFSEAVPDASVSPSRASASKRQRSKRIPP